MQPTETEIKIVFFGTSRISVIVLDEMARAGILPSLIVTAPPRPKGRGLELSPSEVKVWADAHSIPTLEPVKLDPEFLRQLSCVFPESEPNVKCQMSNVPPYQLFIIASYGKIIPRAVLDMPKHGTLNMHPSLLPKLRGASPIQSAILEDAPMDEPHETGVTIMLIDEEVDHGPIVAQEKITIENWPPKGSELEETLGTLGGKLIAKTIPLWVAGAITPKEQDHDQATYTKKMTKGSGHIDLADDPIRMYRKIRAFDIWPRAYFLTTRRRSLRPGRESADSEIRVIVTEAHIADGKLIIDRVIPEGKKEMPYEDFLRGQRDNK